MCGGDNFAGSPDSTSTLGQALIAFLDAIEDENLQWWVAGSVSLSVHGIDVTPCDLDLMVNNASAVKLGELLLDVLVEPVISTTGWLASWFGRAFLQTWVEWVGVDDPYDYDRLRSYQER